ncbi:hypothetical protein A4U94_01320 [Prescottella equi]|uniref:hypothetical protein n=1 Tax=Rhodococcus hoagii TaxID=43767 RepID=UPI0009BDF491|nr:hypothetical protein [Prescottella equi]OQQ28712.1 hypothetical protein A4U94_01320 [Prescottella equi]
MAEWHGYFLDEQGQIDLYSTLDEVPEVVDALAGILCDGYRSRISYEPKVVSSQEFSIPYDTSAQDAANYLVTELYSWANHVCEHRGQTYDGAVTPIAIAKWLQDNMTSLAMTPGSEEAPRAIRKVVRSARRAARLSSDLESWRYNSTHVARNTQLNASAIEVAAKELGPEYAKLTRERVKGLRRTGRIEPVREFEGVPIYRLGDVMDAHLAAATRNRASA